MADIVSFSSFELIAGDEVPDKAYLDNAFAQDSHEVNHGDSSHIINCKVIEDRFYWLYSNFGKTMPHPHIVVDSQLFTKHQNLRTENQFEPTKQLFAIYDIQSTLFYISNLLQKKFIEHFLKDVAGKEVVIKEVYKTVNDFIEAIQSISKIQFTGSRDLINQNSDLHQRVRNVYGYDEPDHFSIEARWERPMSDRLKDTLRGFAQHQKDGDIKTLVCIGKDDRGLSTVFNTNSFIKKIDIPIQRDEQSLFPPDVVENQIILKLKDIYNASSS